MATEQARGEPATSSSPCTHEQHAQVKQQAEMQQQQQELPSATPSTPRAAGEEEQPVASSRPAAEGPPASQAAVETAPAEDHQSGSPHTPMAAAAALQQHGASARPPPPASGCCSGAPAPEGGAAGDAVLLSDKEGGAAALPVVPTAAAPAAAAPEPLQAGAPDGGVKQEQQEQQQPDAGAPHPPQGSPGDATGPAEPHSRPQQQQQQQPDAAAPQPQQQRLLQVRPASLDKAALQQLLALPEAHQLAVLRRLRAHRAAMEAIPSGNSTPAKTALAAEAPAPTPTVQAADGQPAMARQPPAHLLQTLIQQLSSAAGGRTASPLPGGAPPQPQQQQQPVPAGGFHSELTSLVQAMNSAEGYHGGGSSRGAAVAPHPQPAAGATPPAVPASSALSAISSSLAAAAAVLASGNGAMQRPMGARPPAAASGPGLLGCTQPGPLPVRAPTAHAGAQQPAPAAGNATAALALAVQKLLGGTAPLAASNTAAAPSHAPPSFAPPAAAPHMHQRQQAPPPQLPQLPVQQPHPQPLLESKAAAAAAAAVAALSNAAAQQAADASCGPPSPGNVRLVAAVKELLHAVTAFSAEAGGSHAGANPAMVAAAEPRGVGGLQQQHQWLPVPAREQLPGAQQLLAGVVGAYAGAHPTGLPGDSDLAARACYGGGAAAAADADASARPRRLSSSGGNNKAGLAALLEALQDQGAADGDAASHQHGAGRGRGRPRGSRNRPPSTPDFPGADELSGDLLREQAWLLKPRAGGKRAIKPNKDAFADTLPSVTARWAPQKAAQLQQRGQRASLGGSDSGDDGVLPVMQRHQRGASVPVRRSLGATTAAGPAFIDGPHLPRRRIKRPRTSYGWLLLGRIASAKLPRGSAAAAASSGASGDLDARFAHLLEQHDGLISDDPSDQDEDGDEEGARGGGGDSADEDRVTVWPKETVIAVQQRVYYVALPWVAAHWPTAAGSCTHISSVPLVMYVDGVRSRVELVAKIRLYDKAAHLVISPYPTFAHHFAGMWLAGYAYSKPEACIRVYLSSSKPGAPPGAAERVLSVREHKRKRGASDSGAGPRSSPPPSPGRGPKGAGLQVQLDGGAAVNAAAAARGGELTTPRGSGQRADPPPPSPWQLQQQRAAAAIEQQRREMEEYQRELQALQDGLPLDEAQAAPEPAEGGAAAAAGGQQQPGSSHAAAGARPSSATPGSGGVHERWLMQAPAAFMSPRNGAWGAGGATTANVVSASADGDRRASGSAGRQQGAAAAPPEAAQQGAHGAAARQPSPSKEEQPGAHDELQAPRAKRQRRGAADSDNVAATALAAQDLPGDSLLADVTAVSKAVISVASVFDLSDDVLQQLPAQLVAAIDAAAVPPAAAAPSGSGRAATRASSNAQRQHRGAPPAAAARELQAQLQGWYRQLRAAVAEHDSTRVQQLVTTLSTDVLLSSA